jgi:hypothetical protein
MSESNTASQPIQSNSQQVASTTPTTPGITYSWQPVTIPNNNQSVTTQQPSKQEREPDSENKPGQTGPESGPFVTNPPDKEEPKEAPLNKDLPASVPELQKMVVTQQELMRDLQKRFSALEKDNSVRKQTEQRYFAASKVARYANLFKSKDAFEKEVDVALRYSSVMSEQELEQYLADKFGKAVPVAKSAAAAIVAQPEVHEVPDFKQNNAAVVSSDNNRKFLELMDMFNTGGSS